MLLRSARYVVFVFTGDIGFESEKRATLEKVVLYCPCAGRARLQRAYYIPITSYIISHTVYILNRSIIPTLFILLYCHIHLEIMEGYAIKQFLYLLLVLLLKLKYFRL